MLQQGARIAKNLAIDDRIFVPASMLDVDDVPSAFVETWVQEVAARSVRIVFRGEDHWIASSRCQRDIGLLIICIVSYMTMPLVTTPPGLFI